MSFWRDFFDRHMQAHLLRFQVEMSRPLGGVALAYQLLVGAKGSNFPCLSSGLFSFLHISYRAFVLSDFLGSTRKVQIILNRDRDHF